MVPRALPSAVVTHITGTMAQPTSSYPSHLPCCLGLLDDTPSMESYEDLPRSRNIPLGSAMLSDTGGVAPVLLSYTGTMLPSAESKYVGHHNIKLYGAQSLQPLGLRPFPLAIYA